MKKIILLLLISFFMSGFSPLELFPAFKNLKSDIVVQLNDMFDREVSVESVSGNLINQIELNNVSIAKTKKLSEGAVIRAKKIVINYSPLRLAASRGNISAAISGIEINGPEILVERDERDHWNMADLVPQTRPVDEKEKARPLSLSAKITIKDGYGIYMDRMGWGEPLNGRVFTSKIKDLNAEVKVAGNRMNVSGTATSVIEKSIAYTKVNGNINIRTGKYRFNVTADNVDIEKWGYYTLNIPHFKPISGTADMKMEMTNPPPRKKGLPIFFDGKFNLRNGKAIVFGKTFEGISGFVWVRDENAVFRNLSGKSEGIPINANGRLFDFSVANYDIVLDIPMTTIPRLDRIDLKGSASAKVHVGGNYGHPLFAGSSEVEGLLFGKKLKAEADFRSDGPIFHVSSDKISMFEGSMYANGIIDLTPSVPAFDITMTGESLSLREILPVYGKDRIDFRSEIIGSAEKFKLYGKGKVGDEGNLSWMGSYESGGLDLRFATGGFMIYSKYLNGKLSSFEGRLTGATLKGVAEFAASSAMGQPFTGISADFKLKGSGIDFTLLTLKTARSQIFVKGTAGIGRETDLHITAISAEVSDLKLAGSFLNKEFLPVSGRLNADILISGNLSREADIVPSSFTSEGSISLKDGSYSQEKFSDISINYLWRDGVFWLNDGKLITRTSNLSMAGSLETGGNINMLISGDADLEDIKPLTLKYGRLYGQSRISARLSGPMNNFLYDADFDIRNLRYNELSVDRMSGRAFYDGKNLFFARPLDIIKANDEYLISGKYTFSKKPDVSLKMQILKGDMGTIFSLIDEINRELSAKQIFGTESAQKVTLVEPSKLMIHPTTLKQLYKTEGTETALEEVKKAEAESSAFVKMLKERPSRRVGGKIYGTMEIRGNIDSPSGNLDLNLSDGTWETYTFDEARLNGGLESGTFEIRSAYIKKGDGIISANGTYNPSSSASLELTATNMPIDFLSLFIGGGKSFNGKFNMESYVRGPSSSLHGLASINTGKANIAGVSFDRIDCIIGLEKNTVYFRKVELGKEDKKAVLFGVIPLTGEGVSLDITAEGESLGLLTLASPDISWLGGSGIGHVNISGSLSHPRLNGDLVVNNAAVYIRMIESTLESINGSMEMIDNSISTSSLSAKWVGKWTQNNVNRIRLSGSFGWDGIFSKDKAMEVSLSMKDGSYTVDLPGLYKGDLDVTGFTLIGPLWAGTENPKAPTISGTFELSNGVIQLPDITKKSPLPPFGMNMRLNILKNTYLEAGDIKNLLSPDLSNLLLNLEISGNDISFSGNIESPIITGKTSFGRGTVSILNREFTLMNVDRQKNLFSSNLDKVNENTAVFSGGSLPFLTLSAEIKVKNIEKVSETVTPGQPKTITYKTSNVLVVSRISGIPYAREKEQGLTLSFSAFSEDTSKQPPEISPANYDEEQIKVLLLPDFIKNSLGLSEKGVTEVDANEVLVDYLNSRLNAYLLRDVERNVAKTLDLESLTLEYNFSSDLRNVLPPKTPTAFGPQEPETMYGIGAVKGFFDRFYLNVNYQQAAEQQTLINKTLLNYEVTYKLSPSFSVVYYREPFSFLQEQSEYYKVTLKSGYEF